MQKTILKHQYENFTASRSEGLDKTYDRFQNLISQLEIHGEVISREDANLKLLRSLPLAWNNIALIMRNKSDLDTISMNDLYNNLKVYEAEIKSQSSSSSNSHNVAFISSENTSSTNEAVNTAHEVSTASSQEQASSSTYVDDVMFSFFVNQSNSPQLDNEDREQIDTDDLEEMDLKWQVVMHTIRVKRFLKKTGRNLNFNGKETVGSDKTKVECYNCHRKGHFVRECRASRNQGNRNEDAPRRIVPVETPANALVVQDGIGYRLGLESLEARFVVHQKNEAVYEEDIAFLKYDVKGNPQYALQDQGIFDSGCSRHMTGNKSYLTDYQDIDGGFIAFAGSPKGGKITGKGKIRTGKLDFENVYFVKELKFNLFFVSQMCDKKNSVLFTETECLILSPDFKLLDESQVLLKVPRQKNMCDNGTEFKNSEMNQFCEMKGIKREFSVARTPQQNGSVTTRNQTTDDACIETNVNAVQTGQEKASNHEYILLPFLTSDSQENEAIRTAITPMWNLTSIEVKDEKLNSAECSNLHLKPQHHHVVTEDFKILESQFSKQYMPRDGKSVLINKGKVTGQREVRSVWNNAQRVKVLTKSGQVPVNTAKQSFPRAAISNSTAKYVNTDASTPTVNGKVTPLFESMLVQNQAPEGESSVTPPEPQPTPSTSQPNISEPQTELLQTETPPTVSYEPQTEANIEKILPSPSIYQRKSRKTQKHRRAKKVTELPQTSMPLDLGADEVVHKEGVPVAVSGAKKPWGVLLLRLDIVPPTPHDSPILGGYTPRSDE
ncbi:ribonuclease H-like domain-containing protein, partial [Tanacetum coccineum]